MFSHEEAELIKNRILEELERTNIENKEQVKEYIRGLNEEQLELFIKQNNLKVLNSDKKPIFQKIVENNVISYKIAENDKAIAILEINPLSNGHSIILPKEKTPVEKMNKSCFVLAKKIANKIKSVLKPKEIKIETFSLEDYPAINIIPIYDKPLKKSTAGEEELKELQKKLQSKTRIIKSDTVLKKSEKSSKIPEISFRVP